MNSENLSGTVIAGKYELIRMLGQGGMGAVYEGRNLSTLKRVAVKLLYEELGRDEQVVKRFFREAQASSVIESDYIIQIFDSGLDPVMRFPYMVMEMLQGEDIEEVLKRTGPLEPLAVGKIMLQATMGLGKAHENGITHRDIKPANIYLTTREDGDCSIKILDFGIAKVRAEKFADQSSAGLTATGSVLGTPLYMSPEQARGLPTVDARSDVWSLGIVMFELLSGNTPYTEAATLGDLIVAIVTSDLPLLQDRAPWVPPELAEIAHRAISRDLEKRFKSASEMRDALALIVPDGPRFGKDILKGISPDIRQIVAPRLELTQGMLKAVVKTGLALTSTPPPRNNKKGSRGKKGGAPVVAITTAVAGVIALGGLGVGIWKLSARNSAAAEQPPVVATAPVAPPPHEAATPAAPGPAGPQGNRSFQLVVLPGDADVYVDGQKVTVRSEAILLSGAPGTTHVVRIAKGGRDVEAVVAITENGLVPPKVGLNEPIRPGGPIHVTGSKPLPGKPGAPAAPAGDKPAAPGPAKPLITDTNEFQ